MWSGFSILLGDPKKLAIFNIRWYATSRPSFLEQSLASNVLEYTWGKKMSLPRYFSLIHFWLRSNFVNHKPVSYGSSSHHTQCSNKALSFEAATKARSSSDPCWVLGTVGFLSLQARLTWRRMFALALITTSSNEGAHIFPCPSISVML